MPPTPRSVLVPPPLLRDSTVRWHWRRVERVSYVGHHDRKKQGRHGFPNARSCETTADSSTQEKCLRRTAGLPQREGHVCGSARIRRSHVSPPQREERYGEVCKSAESGREDMAEALSASLK